MARKPQHLRGPQPLPEGRVTHGDRELLAALCPVSVERTCEQFPCEWQMTGADGVLVWFSYQDAVLSVMVDPLYSGRPRWVLLEVQYDLPRSDDRRRFNLMDEELQAALPEVRWPAARQGED